MTVLDLDELVSIPVDGRLLAPGFEIGQGPPRALP